MNNEIGRKITSLTLMTIMLAGGLTFAIPGVTPAAYAANANLFVSAENSQFENYMSGPQVIEVLVNDSSLGDTSEAKGEPDVTVNGNILRMAQAVDGNWYGYFADRVQAQIADSTASDGDGLDFGIFCSAASGPDAVGVDFGDTVGFASGQVAGGLPVGSSSGVILTNDNAACTAPDNLTKDGSLNNVLRETKDLNANLGANPKNADNEPTLGQIGIINHDTESDTFGAWPFIQLYDLNPTGNVVIQYNKGGGTQSVTLTFDTVDKFASASLDRSVYPQESQVHATITDLWLNIDPTDEDSWTFGTNSDHSTAGSYYQVFDENGARDSAARQIEDNVLSSLMCEDNCRLLVNANLQESSTPVLTIQDNDDSILKLDETQDKPNINNATHFFIPDGTITKSDDTTKTLTGIPVNSVPVTITEQGPNTGVFGTYDESDKSVLAITAGAKRGNSASIDYNETPITVLVGYDTATIDIKPIDDEWSSGEEIPIVIVDGDQNKNSRVDEDLDVHNPDVSLIPALTTGDPFTIGEGINDEDDSIQAILLGASGINKGEVGFDDDFGNLGNIRITGVGSNNMTSTVQVQPFSERAILEQTPINVSHLVIDLETTLGDLRNTIKQADDKDSVFNFFNYNVESFGANRVTIYLLIQDVPIINNDRNAWDLVSSRTDTDTDTDTDTMNAFLLVEGASSQDDYVSLDKMDIIGLFNDDVLSNEHNIGYLFAFNQGRGLPETSVNVNDREVVIADFFSFGFTDDGVQVEERIANQIIRIEAEESGDNTSTFEGSLEYVMVNQLNIIDVDTFAGISPIADDPSFIVIEDLTDEDAPRVSYNDIGRDGAITAISDQEEAPSHSGIVSLNQDSYKVADTVIITLEDLDLNVDSDLVDIYTVVDKVGDLDNDQVGKDVSDDLEFSFGSQGRLLDVTFDDIRWQNVGGDKCTLPRTGLGSTGFTLVETDIASGKFTGDFQIPKEWCRDVDTGPETVTGLDIEVNYVDYRDASGEIIEVNDSSGIRANTGSVSLDRTVYPVPFGTLNDFTAASNDNTTPSDRSIFPIHSTGIDGDNLAPKEVLANGDLTIHVRVNDPDFDVNPSGADTINDNVNGKEFGPVKISVIRGSDTVILGYAGGPTKIPGLIGVGDDDHKDIRQLGPIAEIAPDAGIYELDLTVKFTDGPSSKLCPDDVKYEQLADPYTNEEGAVIDSVGNAEERFRSPANTEDDYCILQGDILQVEYTDPTDASGDVNTVTDSATFDLRNGVLQSDKLAYIIGSDMILTLIEPDFDLDNDTAETYDLDLIEWDSDAATTTMGDLGGENNASAFDPEPTDFRETGTSTGIFQIVIEIPEELDGDGLERGEEILLEYTDWGPSGSDYVGDEDEDVNIKISTSNFGATVELDQKVYTWTDKVYITIVAPDHNFDSDLIDEIGDSSHDPLKVSTRGSDLDEYKLVETGPDTGIFTGEVILTGFTAHDADGDGVENDASGIESSSGSGPTNGMLPTDDVDGISVSFEFSDNETVVGSALIRWNIGEVQWLEASYPASGTGVVRVIDPDMNLNPEAVDNFNVDVWSDSDAGGIDLTVTETNEATGIFEGTVFFTVTEISAGHRLRVAEGDTVTSQYEDNTLPDPYSTADELKITATSLIGTVVPPLERVKIDNLRAVDAFGNSLDTVSVDQQVQFSADLASGQEKDQVFAYLVQIQDKDDITVKLDWITGSLNGGQSFSPAVSWTPTNAGTYTATVFVWESVDNPTALSPQIKTTVSVN